MKKHSEVTGFVLAGGKSSRMGTDKALLSLNGVSLLQQTKTILEQVCEKVFILGSRQLYGAYGECYEDLYANCGPLSGIHAALLNSSTPYSLVTAVDTPFVSAQFFSYMIGRALDASAIVTAPRIGGVVQPACAVFSRAFLPIAEAALKSGKYKVEPTFPPERTLLISEAELARFAKAADMFENLNTPEDFERARKRFSGQQL
ncbi:MAG TPA: molybdenum cofactor guanylyltransferase [Candidatus Angelobacter sp.]|nr:molybdenum cofactor guanylyltransferase [Candidatus Angelobacter sp.]